MRSSMLLKQVAVFSLILGLFFLPGCRRKMVVRIVTEPEKAVVKLENGTTLGETPFEYEWDGKPETLIIEKEGYQPVTQAINLTWAKYQKGRMQVTDNKTLVIPLTFTLEKEQ